MINLFPFCGGRQRESFARPFSFGAHTYATDSTILLRVDRRPGVPDIDRDPGLDRIWPKYWPTGLRELLQPWRLPAPYFEHCWGCDDGEQRGHPCRECGGSRRLPRLDVVSVIGIAEISLFNARRLAILPRLRVGAGSGIEGYQVFKYMTILAFEFEEGAGIVAPLYDIESDPVVAEI